MDPNLSSVVSSVSSDLLPPFLLGEAQPAWLSSAATPFLPSPADHFCITCFFPSGTEVIGLLVCLSGNARSSLKASIVQSPLSPTPELFGQNLPGWGGGWGGEGASSLCCFSSPTGDSDLRPQIGLVPQNYR